MIHFKYKTKLCNAWISKGECSYGHRCQFAHGYSELKKEIRYSERRSFSPPTPFVPSSASPPGFASKIGNRKPPTNWYIPIKQRKTLDEKDYENYWDIIQEIVL